MTSGWLNLLHGLMLAAVTTWKLLQQVRSSPDPSRRAVTAALFCALVAYVGGIADSGAPGRMGWCVVHLVGLMLMVFALLAFYTYAGYPRAQAHRHVTRHLVPLTLALVVVLVGALLTPSHVASGAFPVFGVGLAHLAANLYVLVGLASIVPATRAYAAGAEPRLRHGLALVGASIVTMVLASTVLLVMIVLLWLRVPPQDVYSAEPLFTTANIVLVTSILLFMIGVCYPAITQRLATWRTWARHWRTHHQLGPLWRHLHDAFPQDQLERAPRWGRFNPFAVHRRYYRRAIECRDGLVRLSPCLVAVEADLDAPTPQQLHNALDLYHHSSQRPATAAAVAVPTIANPKLDDEIAVLVQISNALRRTPA